MIEAQQVDGVYLPAGETHLIEHMAKNRRLVDGRGTYQYQKLEAALKYVPANRRRTALDIGAHVGLWSMHLVKAFQCLHAFEPVPVFADLWAWNVLGVGTSPEAEKQILHRVALGNDKHLVDFQIPVESTGNSHVAIHGIHPGTRWIAHPERIHTVEGVQMVRLDDLGLKNVDFVKIDVEGFERQVLLGGEKTIRRDQPIMVVEQKGNDAAYGEPPQAALRLLEKWGAKVQQAISGDYIMTFCKPCSGVRNAIDKMRGKL